jgi:DNA-damage-inducible protein D
MKMQTFQHCISFHAPLVSAQPKEQNMDSQEVMQRLEGAKKLSAKGGEYWMARDIQETLGYSRWENFVATVRRAVQSCKSDGKEVRDHFLGVRKMVGVGSGAKVEVDDFFLTRYACYLIAMSGDTAKPEIAAAQRYFATQTRLREQDMAELQTQERLRLRGKLKDATKLLHSAASQAGVTNFGTFNHKGHLGLYEMGLAELKKRKGIPDSEDLYDCIGRLELSANEFKAQLTEESIKVKGIRGQARLEIEHKRMGQVVRQTVHRETGVLPENLPAEPSIKKLGGKATPKKISPP